jgi:hypothetical protein
VYVNFAGLGEDAERDAVYGPSVQRLDQIQEAYDPEGIFMAAARRP